MFNNKRRGIKRPAGESDEAKEKPCSSQQMDSTKSLEESVSAKKEMKLSSNQKQDKPIDSETKAASESNNETDSESADDVDSYSSSDLDGDVESTFDLNTNSDSDSVECPPIASDGSLILTNKNCLNQMSTWKQLKRVTLTGNQLEKILNVPLFRETIIGSFVVLKANSGPELKIFKVLSFHPGKKFYKLGNKSTNLVIKLKTAFMERHFLMSDVANERPTRKEFIKWYAVHRRYSLALPTNLEIYVKQIQIKWAMEMGNLLSF